jgi:uncharacterized protein
MKRLLKIIAAVFVLLLCMRTSALAANTEYVRDDYGQLSASEIDELNQLAANVSDAHKAGVYVRVMPDMGNYFSIEEYAEAVYKDEEMGYGDSNDGILLILDMNTRSFDIFVPHGGKSAEAFGTYARERLADKVVNGYLRYNEYAEGFSEYIAVADQYYSYAEAGTPISQSFDPEREAEIEKEKKQREAAEKAAKTGITAGVPPIIALMACFVMKSRNKTTGIKKEAGDYIAHDGIRLINRHDRFLYRTQTRTIRHHDDRGGGGGSGFHSSSSSFGSHTSGHF